jgi:hypothetical protein
MAKDPMIQMTQTAFAAPISILALYFSHKGSVRGSIAGAISDSIFMATRSVKQGFSPITSLGEPPAIQHALAMNCKLQGSFKVFKLQFRTPSFRVLLKL